MPYPTDRNSSRPAAITPRQLAVLLAALWLIAVAWPCFAQDRAVQLEVGGQREIVVEQGLTRVAIGDPAVADVMLVKLPRGGSGGSGAANPTDGRVLVLGKAPGRTTLMVWPKGAASATSYDVQVSVPAPAALASGQPGRVTTAGRTAVVDGAVRDMESHRRLTAAAAAAAAAGGAVVDRSVVAVRGNTVQVEVKIVEFSKSALKEAGFNFFNRRGYNSHGFNFQVGYPGGGNPAATFPATSGAPASIGQAFGLVFDFRNAGATLALNLLESNGLARVLAEPTLVALSGQSASFLAGGEIPVPVPQSLGAVSIEYKQFGIGLTVTPTILADDRIVLKVAPEASDLDFTNAVTLNGVAVPAITTRRADTTIELGDGESFVIGGLVSRNTLSSVDKVPLLGDLPVLGAFFKRQSWQQNERELVIMVTPHLVRPMAAGAALDAAMPGQGEGRGTNLLGSFLVPRRGDFVPGFSN